jgi:hypothetical protein
MNEYFSENVEVRGYVKPGVSADILVKTASNDLNSYAVVCEDGGCYNFQCRSV